MRAFRILSGRDPGVKRTLRKGRWASRLGRGALYWMWRARAGARKGRGREGGEAGREGGRWGREGGRARRGG